MRPWTGLTALCVGNSTIDDRSGLVSHMMIDHLNCIADEHPATTPQLSKSQPHVDYNSARNDLEPFPNTSLLDPIDDDQHENV